MTCLTDKAANRAIRIALGRPAVRHLSNRRVPGYGWVTQPAHLFDPMLELEHARRTRRYSEAAAMRYGELLQRVVSPVLLPDTQLPMPWSKAA